MDNTKTRFIPVTLIAVILICGSGCATSHSHSTGWEYVVIERNDYPGLNDPPHQIVYSFPWQVQLNRFEQQGWRVDSVSIIERDLADGEKLKSARIIFKRAKNPKPETHMVIVATCKESDKIACALVYGTLREHGIVAIGVGNGGWNDVNVDASRAAEARKILSGLSTEGHSFRVIDK